MNSELKTFIDRVEAFEIDQDEKSLRFVDRLARESIEDLTPLHTITSRVESGTASGNGGSGCGAGCGGCGGCGGWCCRRMKPY